jgi:hypothetical protein
MKTLTGIVLSVSLCVFLLTSCARETTESMPKEMNGILASLPQDADIVGYLNLDRITDSELAGLFTDSSRLPDVDKHLSEFHEMTGLDPQKDIHELYIAADKFDDDDGFILLLIFGDFDSDKILNFLESQNLGRKLEQVQYRDYVLYRTEGDDAVLCVKDEHTVVAGRENGVKEWLDSAEKKSREKQLAERVAPIRFKQTGWITVDAQDQLTQMMDEEILEKLEGLKTAALSFDVGKQLRLTGTCLCTETEKAELFCDTMKGALAAAKLHVSDNRKLVDILNKIHIIQRRETIHVDFKMTRPELEQLLDWEEDKETVVL